MNGSPAYFESIRQRASQRWNQLESDPELAGPWHLLFKQVQSPRHILSELLQNADDAGATEASVRIESGAFIFKHNGEDFTEEHFASLCRFGYSNKRALHTIGFRGIGFKSTFSLGRRVELFTPTLSVVFDQDRFTEPKWANGNLERDGLTTVRVVISDDHRRDEVEKNLQEWLKSPVSLLFFKHIRHIQIGDNELHWGGLGPGPVRRTEWLALHDDNDKRFLIAHSDPEPFPEVALDEIRKERMLNIDEYEKFPACILEIVLGIDGRLFVVLPTGVKTALPFACNAPFIQDPARLKIKDPETSPTNRWLLQRAGQFAGEVMLEWLRMSSSDPVERARAYDLMPDVDRDDSSLEGVCGAIVEKEFAKVLDGQKFLLTDDDQLTASKQSIILPEAILDVWPSAQATALLDDGGRPALSRHVSVRNRNKLLMWDEIEEIDVGVVLNVLQGKHLPKPKNWRHLLSLWVYIAQEITGHRPYRREGYRYLGREKGLCILPVQGKEILCAADEVARLGEKKLLQSDDDWQFLGDRLSVLNQNWLRYLTEQRRLAESNNDDELSISVASAYSVLEVISLNEPSDTGKVIDQVAADFFSQKTVTLVDVIRISQIASKLGASVGNKFRYVCQDRGLRSIDKTILFDADGTLDLLLPEEWSKSHILHSDYLKSFTSCTREEWLRWVSNGRSSLHTFVPFVEIGIPWLYGRKVLQELKRRGFEGQFEPRYKNPGFAISDWDFEEVIWEHWEILAEEDSSIWSRVAEKIMLEPDRFWSGNLSATVTEISSNGHSRRIIRDGLAPSWIIKLRGKECLRDTHGIFRKPEELLRRTAETEALMDVEPFIHALLDNETTRPLLKLLGVGDIPTGPDKLIGRLQTLASSDNSPVHEVEKWYRRIDQMLDGCSTEDFSTIKDAFSNEKIILSENGIWVDTSGIFLSSDEEDAPDAETVRASVRDLTLWRKIGVAERPTAELAIIWLQSLPSGEPLSPEDARRVRSLLKRHAERIWVECEHWINLAGEWASVDDLGFALTLHPLIPWAHLYKWVKQKTADFRQLSLEISSSYPFSEISLLAEHVDDRFNQNLLFRKKPEKRPWLNQLGTELRRISLDDDEETERIRELGSNLFLSTWQTTPGLEIISYIDGTPAGTPRHADAVWLDRILYAEDHPLAKLARAVCQELDRSFRRPDIADAIKLCFDRPPEFITNYMEENFTLIPRMELASQETREEHDDENASKSNEADPHDIDSDVEIDGEDFAGDTELNDHDHGDDQPLDSNNSIEQGDDDNDIEELADELVLEPQPKPKPAKPSVIERYALTQDFKKDADSRYFHEDGRSIDKVKDSSFTWEQRSKSGEVLCHYWPKEHCLERESLQLDADIWGLIDKQPKSYSLILLNIEGYPVEVSGVHLRTMKDSGKIILYPSTYRIVYDHDE
jgi:hypothetical protein